MNGPQRYCAIPRCPQKASIGRYCPDHRAKRDRYGRPWERVRRAFLAADSAHWFCKRCGVLCTRPQVDHIIPFRGNLELRDDPTNLQTLCKECHRQKTTEDQRL